VGGIGLGELPKILSFPIIFLQRLWLMASNLARRWGWPKPSMKTTPEGKEVDVALGCGSSHVFWAPFNISATAALFS